ncbi:bifunctional diguanylate cyclase/phosphodiesterase [Salinisphaera sp. Q1T1-3]|uniref:bifunctional diguanylate cyclase/phosphodiesterase n=1 Tax=Salinisphaera sp. Q1T1-3 TaxID=2321229 RepID=UPI001313E769|nr:bifunctional diguanylate cyclase/phosphodiesterase [Salinisphaera sp. Q1T1-3]
MTTALDILEQHAQAGTWRFDPETEELWWSPGVYRLHGLDPETDRASIESALSFYEPDSRARLEAALAHAQSSGEGWNLTLTIRRADGVLRQTQGIGEVRPRPGRPPLLAGAFFDIHEAAEARDRQQAIERALAEQAHRWQTAGEHAGLGLMEIDITADRYRISGAFVQRNGLGDCAELTLAGTDWQHLIDERDRAGRNRRLNDHLAGRTEAFESEFRLRVHGRVPIWVRETGRAVRADDAPTRIVGTLADIDARKRTEHALQQSQRRLRQTLHHAPIGIALVAPEGRWISVNHALCEMIGYDEAELGALTFQDITHPDDLEADMVLVSDLLTGRKLNYRLEKRYFHKDGHTVDIQLDVSLLRDEAGEPLYFIAQIQDITERKRQHRALFEARELAEITFEAIGEGVIRLDRYGTITQVNSAACALLDRSADSLIQHAFTECVTFYHADFDQILPNPLSSVLIDGGRAAVPLFTRIMRHDGSMIAITDSLSAIYHDDGRVGGAVFVFQDITEARQRTMELSHQASHDTLTGLANRRGFQRDLAATWRRARNGMLQAFVMYLDLDHFKAVNDSCGHAAGDDLLRLVAERLRAVLRDSDVLARLGGDEFAAIVHANDADGARVVAEKFLRSIRALHFVRGERTYRLGLSLGIAALDTTLEGPEASLAHADDALYRAKAAGRNDYRFHEPANAATTPRRRLSLHLAPIVDQGSHVVAQELTLRAPDVARHGPMSSGVATAGETVTPSSTRIDQSTLDMAIELLEDASEADALGSGPLCISLNAIELADPAFQNRLFKRLGDRPHLAPRLIFQLAEHNALFDSDLPPLVARIRGCGAAVWLVEFGSGYDGFELLKRYVFDGVKIAADFARSLTATTINRAVLRAIMDVAKRQRLSVVADGVEDDAVFALLSKAGIQRFQGRLYAPARAGSRAETHSAHTDSPD